MNRWDRFLSHTMDLYWILKKVSDTGILVDKEQRANFRLKLLAELKTKEMELDSLIPQHLCKHKDYERTPLPFRCANCKGNGCIKNEDHCPECKGTGAKIRAGFDGDKRVGRIPRETETISGSVAGRSGEYYSRSVTESGRI